MTFCLKKDEQKNLPEEENAVKSEFYAGHFAGKHVLLVEDNELNREIALYLLEDMKIRVDTAKDGVEAVEKVKASVEDTYDLILMDVQMPNMNGYEATMAIRKLEDRAFAEIPIIAMTANAFEEDRKDALAAGMNGHIAKPVDVVKLAAAMDEVFSGGEKNDRYKICN